MNAGQYKVKWFYSEDKKTTVCRIFNDKEEVVGESTIKRYAKDQFIKDVARRVSMQKAITNGELNKEIRTILWNGYKDMRPISKWIKLNP